VDHGLETLGPPEGWQALKGLRGDIDLDALGAICDLPQLFAYATFATALRQHLHDRPPGRARAFHYRDIALVVGLMEQHVRNNYRRTAVGDTFCQTDAKQRRDAAGAAFMANPAVMHVVAQLFEDSSNPHHITRIQDGRAARLITSQGVRILPDVAARAIAWGLLQLLDQFGLASGALVTIDIETGQPTEGIAARATTGRMINLITHRHIDRSSLQELARVVGQRGPNFLVASIRALTLEGLRRGIEPEAVTMALRDWWQEDPTRVHLVEISEAVSLFGVPRVGRSDIRQLALDSYLRIGERVFSHVYLLEGVERT
jgi:hypothetical protein